MVQRSENPIRHIVESIKKPDNPEKEMIPLSLGDPTVFGNLKTPDFFVRKIEENLRSFKCNGYVHSAGRVDAREAVAQRYQTPTSPLTSGDVILASGCSGALDLAISALADEGDNIVIPQPGFPLYETLAKSKGIDVHHYRLLPDRSWEVDLEDLERCIDSRTRALVVTNPSNPCGSVYTKAHLEAILAVAERNCVPIIADEIYGNLVFSGSAFHPIASLTSTVPVLSTGGIAKEFLVPGWRVGWVLVHDRNSIFEEVRTGLFQLSQLILGCNSLIQSALPTLLAPAPGSDDERELQEFGEKTLAELEQNASFTVEQLRGVLGIRTVVPQGAMYVMVELQVDRFHDIADDMEFTQKLLDEESVFVLPGRCFGMPNFARLVFSAPREKLAIAYDRMSAFCTRHANE